MYIVPKQAKYVTFRPRSGRRFGELPKPLFHLPVLAILVGILVALTAIKPARAQEAQDAPANAGPKSSQALDASAFHPAAAFRSESTGIASNLATIQPAASPPAKPIRTSPRIAFGASVGTQGIGMESAVSLGEHLNLRGGADLFHYSTTLSQDGISYDAKLSMRSGQVSLDWFPFKGGFHISPGVMFYNGTQVHAGLSIPVGQSFTLNDTDYYSSADDPLVGSAKVTFPTAGPRLTFGFGSLVPRSERKHISIPTEFGFAYFGTGKALLNFSGSACSTPNDPETCEVVTSDPTFQSNLDVEQSKIQKNLSYVRFFPIVRVGISYSF